MDEAFFAGRCTAVTEDSSALAAAIVGRANAADFAQLPEIISKEPLGPYLRRGDDAWLAVVRLEQRQQAMGRGALAHQVHQRTKARHVWRTGPSKMRLGGRLGVET